MKKETIITGGLSNVGSKLNKTNSPTHYLEKHYPIKGRTNFFKWCIVTPNGLAKDFEGNEMYFDSIEPARKVLRAIKKTIRLNTQHLNS